MSSTRKTKKHWKRVETFNNWREQWGRKVYQEVVFDYRKMKLVKLENVKPFRITQSDINGWREFNKRYNNGFDLWMKGIRAKQEYQWREFLDK